MEGARCEPPASCQAHTHEHIYTCKNMKEALGFVKIRSQVTVRLMASHAVWYFISKLRL